MKPKHKNKSNFERYNLENSPLSMNPTQKELAELLQSRRDELRRLVNYKEQCIIRRDVKIGGKVRSLAYPNGQLRVIHERLKFQLNKIKQPSHLFCPRKGKSQRDNAMQHLDSCQYLTLDLQQFYPSTKFSLIKNWFINELGMYEDVAGLLTHLITVDQIVSLGSPLTPILCSLIHRKMFTEIANLCASNGLQYSVWVDDLTISGTEIPGNLLEKIRGIIQTYGLRSHKISYRTGNRTVFITGIGIVGSELVAPNKLQLRVKELWELYHAAKTHDERENITQLLLSQMGTMKYIVGAKSTKGMEISCKINSLKMKRDKDRRNIIAQHQIRYQAASNKMSVPTWKQ